MDQMGVERTAELSAGVAGQRMRKADRSSVVVGEDLGTRDDKVNGVGQEEHLQQHRPEVMCKVMRRDRDGEWLRHYVASQQHTSLQDLSPCY